jgi:hypothetical protein
MEERELTHHVLISRQPLSSFPPASLSSFTPFQEYRSLRQG